jgi:hypothetical protein
MMLRKILLAAPLVGLLSLGGCATTGTNVNAVIEQVRQVAVATCGFLPTVETVAAIISAGNPLVSGASAVANAICAAVASIPPRTAGRRGGAVPTVAGVVVHGRFVR